MNQDNDTVLAVSHAGAIMMFTDLWYNSETLHTGGFTNCSIVKFTFEELINI